MRDHDRYDDRYYDNRYPDRGYYDNRAYQRPTYQTRGIFSLGQGPSAYEIREPAGGKFKFSKTEIQHLGIAYIVLVICFAIVLSTGLGGIIFGVLNFDIFIQDFLFILPASLLAVGLGFILHETAHKFTAQHFGCWSEFRYDKRGLLMALFWSAVIGFVYAAPGATWFSGHVTKRENGIISLAGPASNMAIASAFLPFLFLFPVDSLIWYYITLSGFIIAFLGAFNMLPIYPLDGSKILKWNIGVFILAIVAAIALGVFYWLALSTTLIFP